MNVDRMLDSLSATQLLEWQAFYRLEEQEHAKAALAAEAKAKL